MKTHIVHGKRVSRVLLFAFACLGVFFSAPIRSDRYDLMNRWQHPDATMQRPAGSDAHRLTSRELP